MAVIAFLFSMNVNAHEEPKKKGKKKAKTEKSCTIEEKKSCPTTEKKSCCAAKKMEEIK